MQVTETLNEGLKRKLDMSIPAAELNEKLDAKLNELKGRVQLKGFRPGKVPFGHLKKVYGRSAMSEVVREAMNSGIQKTLEEREEKPAQQPEIDLTEDEEALNKMLAGDADLDFSVSYEVLPAVEIMDLSKIEIERPVMAVPDAEVDEQFERFVEANRPFEAKDGAAAEGDRVTMDLEGRIDGEPFEGGSGEGSQLVIGSNQFVPGFEEQLVGVKAGDTKQVTITFPEDYSAEHLASKEAVFDVKVTAVETPSTSEIDDTFAQSVGVESLDKLREAIREQIGQQYMSLTNRHVKRLVLDALDEGHKIDMPERLIASEFETIWGRVMHEVEHHGRKFEDEGSTEEEARKDYQRIADRRVRLGLVLAEIGNRNEIKVTDEELQQALIAEVQRFPGQEQQVYDYYRNTPEALANLRAPIFENKLIDYVISQAKVTDKTVDREALMALAEDDQALLSRENPPDHSGHVHGDDHGHEHHDHDHDHDHGDEEHDH